MSGKLYQVAFEINGKLDSTFNKSFSNAQKQVEKLNAKISDNKSTLKSIDSYQNLNSKLSKSRQAYSEAGNKLRELQKQASDSGVPTKDLANKIQKQTELLSRNRKEVEKNILKMKESKDELKKSGVNTKNLSAEYKRLTEIGKGYKNDQTDLKNKLEAVTKAKSNLSEKVHSLGNSFKLVASVAAVAATTIAAAGLAAFSAAAHFGENAERIQNISQALGLSTDAYQKYQKAAQMAGVTQESFDSTMSIFTKRLGEGRLGQGEFTTSLMKMNRSLAVSLITAKNNEEAFKAAVAGLEQVKGPAEKAALATELFGRSGMDLLPFLQKGSKEVNAMAEKVKKLGGVISGNALEAGAKFDDTMDELKVTLEGLKNRVLVGLIPIVQNLADKFTKFFDDPGKAQKLQESFNKIAVSIGELSDKAGNALIALVENLPAIIDKVSTLVNAFGGLKGITEIIIGIIGVRMAAGIVQTAVAFGQLITALKGTTLAMQGLNLASKGNIFILIAQILITSAILIYDNWDKVKGAFVYLWEKMKELGNWLMNSAAGKIITGFMTNGFQGAINAAGKLTVDHIQNQAQDAQDQKNIEAKVNSMPSSALNKYSNSVNSAINYNPTINLTGAANKADARAGVTQALDASKSDFSSMMSSQLENTARLGYGH